MEQEIEALIKNLNRESKIFVLRQIARAKYAYESGKDIFSLTRQEISDLKKIMTEFYPNVHKINENLLTYDGFLLPLKHCGCEVLWYKHNLSILEPNTLAKMRQKDFIDVGGYVGDSAVLFEREFCDKNIYTFEPTKQNYALLEQTLRLNDSKRIIPVNMGLGAENGTLKIQYNEQNIGGSSALWGNENTKAESTKMTTLDEFVKEHKIEVGFIKVDIEGFEMEFLKGAKNTICTQKPAMLISIYHSGRDYFQIKPLIESWNLGYSFKIYKGTDGNISLETGLFCGVLE